MRALLLVALVLLVVTLPSGTSKKQSKGRKAWGLRRFFAVIRIQKDIIKSLKEQLNSTKALLEETKANLTMVQAELEQCQTDLEECGGGEEEGEDCPDIQQLLIENGETFSVNLSTADRTEGTVLEITFANGCKNSIELSFTCINGAWAGNNSNVGTTAELLELLRETCNPPIVEQL